MALTQKRAEDRFAHIKTQSIKYKFHLILEKGSFYDGISQIQFALNKIPSELALDCKAKEIKSLLINGKQEEKITHENGFLFLNCQSLKEGVNRVVVNYRNKYDNDGNGCISFIDVDGKQYIYTQFQPYHANRVFPTFDQPDLKAPMQLSVISPLQWGSVLSNEYATLDEPFEVEKYLNTVQTDHKDLLKKFIDGKSGRMGIFPSTKLLPTYLYCFVAGPYKKLELKDQYRDIPMSLFCIESLYKYMQGMAPFIFEVTIQCMKFFEQFFGLKYPFNKYDQVFAHEFRSGAMQNAGIVTFNDQYIWKEKVSTDSMLDLANTISHELSHHWFGNLTTMKWWDDLWLNQSFAQFISHFCLEKIKHNMKTINYQSSMSAFLARKAWGYHQDQLVTTHPIRGCVANTVVADSIFDGITYSKGAATMKQLLFLIGEQNFSHGISSYFKKYSFKNATLNDFMNQLEHFFNKQHFTLEEWRKVWIQTASLNQIQPKWNPQNHQENAQLQIIQTPFTESYPTLRPHKIKIAMFKQDSTYDVIETLIKPQQSTIVQYNGTNKYKGVLLNYQDHSFVKTILDKNSIDFFSSGNLVRIEDTLTRTMIWRSFFDMVKDGVISSQRYIDIFEANIPYQTSDSIFEKHFSYINTSINTYTPRRYREELNARIFYFILNLLPKINKCEQNRLVILRSQLTNFADSYLSVKILLAWRQGKYTPLKNYQMTLVQQWKAIVAAFSRRQISDQEKNKLLEHQLSLDNSDQAQLESEKCKAIISKDVQFEQLYKSFKNPANQKSIALKRSIISGWNSSYNINRLKNYHKRFFEQVIDVSKVLQGDHFNLFLSEVLPIHEDLSQSINGLKSIKFGDEQKYDKNKTDVLKDIGDMQRYLKAQKKFEEFNPL